MFIKRGEKGLIQLQHILFKATWPWPMKCCFDVGDTYQTELSAVSSKLGLPDNNPPLVTFNMPHSNISRCHGWRGGITHKHHLIFKLKVMQI